MKHLALLVMLALPMRAFAAPPAPAPVPAPHGKIVLVAYTGPEDMQRMTAPFRHALMMKKTGRLADVAIVVYGRAIAAVSTAPKGNSDPLKTAVKEALDAGIHIYACEHSLGMAGLTRESLVPGVELVPQGAVRIAELVSDGYVPMQY
jgi:intracellular sulfur oxidation DsrE/DsrF family protein